MNFPPEQVRARRLLRLAQLIYDHWEDKSGMDTRFERPPH